MLSANLIIVADLVEPPTELWAFRQLTMLSKYDLELENLICCTEENINFYYKFLKNHGYCDYVSDFVVDVEDAEGIVLMPEYLTCNNKKIVKTKYIRIENILSLIQSIGFWSK